MVVWTTVRGRRGRCIASCDGRGQQGASQRRRWWWSGGAVRGVEQCGMYMQEKAMKAAAVVEWGCSEGEREQDLERKTHSTRDIYITSVVRLRL